MRYLLLVLVCLAAFLPGIGSLPPIDRDEPRFMQASKQMAESGDFIDIRFQDEHRYKKPAGIYWLHNAALVLTGASPEAPAWNYRLVSALGGILSVLATFALGRRLFGEREGMVAAIALAGLFGLGFEARIAKTDAILLATVTIGQAALALVYLATRKGEKAPQVAVWGFWIVQAASILIKGPILPLISALTVAVLAANDRDWRWMRALRPAAGLALCALLVAPWIVLISLRTGWDFWQESVGKDMMGKVASGQESHGFPPGYFVLTYGLMTWPFGAMALAGGLGALSRFRTDPRLSFLLAWYIPWWLVCELVPTKLPHYVLPAYPALLLMMAWWLCRTEAKPSFSGWRYWLLLLAKIGVAAVTIGLAGLAIGVPVYFGSFSWWSLIAAAAFLVAGWHGLASGNRLSPLARVSATTSASVVGVGLLSWMVLPQVDALWPSRAIAAAYEANRPCPGSTLISAGYEEPSLVFLTGTGTILTDGSGAAAGLAADTCALAAIERDQEPAFMAALERISYRAVPVTAIEGVNLSKGRTVLITLYRPAAD